MMTTLSFCFFIFLMVAVGAIASSRKKSTSDDYLMAGRSHGKFMIALSGAASATSGFIMIGAVGAGYTMGMMAVLMPISWFLGDFLFWTLFPDRINRKTRDSHANTIPEFVSYTTTGKRDSGISKLLALISIIFVGLYAVGQFLAAGKAVNAVFDISLAPAILLSCVVILAYCAKGGLQSSIPTQFVQALIMLFTTVGLFMLALVIGGGPAELVNQVRSIDPGLLAIDAGRGYLLMFVFMLGFASAAFVFDIGQPQLLVRIMATKSPEEAAKARWIYLGFMQATWVTMALFGLMMKVLLPDITDPEQALPLFARANLHPVFAGVVMAGIFAAIASTLDAQLLVLSSSIGVDFFPDFYRRMTEKFGVRYQVFTTVLVAVVVALVSIALVGSTTVFTLIVFSSTALGVTVGCAMFISITGWRTSPLAIAVSVLTALTVASLWRYLGLSHYLIEALPAFLVGIVTHQLVIKLVPRRAKRSLEAGIQ